MPSLILTAFLVVFVAQVVSWIGESVLSEYAYALYLRTTQGSLVCRQSELKGDIMKTKQELSRTSAQDQFAKWAKLRRSIDKKLSDLEKLSAHADSLLRHIGAHPLRPTDSNLSSGKTTFTVAFRVFLWVIVNIPQYVIAWRYRSKGVFWLPQGWFNPVVMWWLSFPFAPRGSVSVMTWTWACKAVLQVGGGAVRFIILPIFIPTSATVEKKQSSQKEQMAAQPIPIVELD